ncbi:ribonucleotide reductase [Streptomyces sp. WAC 05977]|nr:ribonucleotide reductase [Streptomyces sp. WAC 05977]
MQLNALLAGQPSEVLTRVLALTRAERKALVPELLAAFKDSSEFIEINPNTYGVRNPLRGQQAATALWAALPASDPLLPKLWIASPTILERVLQDRPLAERKTIALRVIGHQTAWEAVRRMILDGDLEPVRTPEYHAGWFRWAGRFGGKPLAERLRTEPEALTELWELLTIEGNGDASFAAFDKYVRDQDKWSTALLELTKTGEVDRTRLLDLTLDILARDFAAFRAQWYAALHEALAPTPEERTKAQHRYARLCGSGLPRTVSFAVKALSLVDKQGTLDDEVALQHLPAAAAGRGATTAERALKLAGRIADRRPELSDLADEVFEAALTHEASDIRALAIARLGVTPDRAPAIETAEYPEPARPPWDQRKTLTLPLDIPDTPAAVAEALSSLLADPDQADLLLAALDGAHRIASELPDALKPLVKRAARIDAQRYSPAVPKMIATLVLGLTGHDVPPPPKVGDWRRPLHHRITALLEGTAAPVSAATHQGGWLDPVVFVSRMLEHPDAAEDDVVDALLRLAPDTRPEALALASELTGPHADNIRYALGGPAGRATGWIALAAARARHPESADPAAALRGEPGPPFTWTAKAGPSGRHNLTTLDIEPTPEATSPKVPWLGVPFDGPATEWLGFTECHEAVASPYDRDHIEAAVAGYLFFNDTEFGHPVEKAALSPFLDSPSIPGFPGTMLLATTLTLKRSTAVQLGTDAVLTLLDRRMLGPRALGAALGVLGPYLIAPRLASRLSIIANEHPIAVLSTLDTLLPELEHARRGIFALLELAADLVERGAGTISDETKEWLARFKGSSKAAKAASRLRR